jgi:Zn-finger nucleic acid-binding protein
MSAHRDQLAACPSCGTGLDPQGARMICSACGGALVPDAQLEAMMNEMSPDDERPLERRLLPGAAAPRSCPRCTTAMTPHEMYGVTIDRCSAHGVWFDGEELATVLNENGQAYAARQFADRTADSLGGILGQTLRALFTPFLKKRRLEQDIAATSPPDADEP